MCGGLAARPQVAGKLTPAADIFSFGVISEYELIQPGPKCCGQQGPHVLQ
jgi:hypothetical protein